MARTKKIIVLDGNLQEATGETAKALVKAEKAKKAKPALNPHGYAWITPEIVQGVFADKATGMKNADIATKHNISGGSVGTILSGPQWFRSAMAKKGLEMYPEKLARKSTVEAEVQA